MPDAAPVVAAGASASAAAGNASSRQSTRVRRIALDSTRARVWGFGGALLRITTSEMSGPFPFERRFGAFPVGDGRAEFRLWAPSRDAVTLRVGDHEHALEPAGHGVLEATVEARPGEGFEAPALRDSLLYELHVGTFTEEGTFDAAIRHLRALRELGVTTIELMPVAAFPGRHGWGYDGVYISAAHDPYGGPEGLQRFVDAAHGEVLAVLLDVVYNHVGASGVQGLECFGPYFTSHYETPWGRAMNYDDADSDAVREWVLQSAEQWIRDFHLDGLRLDAVHSIMDSSPEHLVAAICRRVHAINARAVVIAESGMNDPKVLGQWGCDGVWADDFHHALRVLLTGDREGYYAEFGQVAQLAKAYRRPHVHDGTYSAFRRRRFGAPAEDVPPERFVVFSSNHDQVGNRAFGDRPPPATRPLAALL